MTAGDTIRAASDLSMASHLVRSFHPKDTAKDGMEYQDCAWSLAVLHRYQASVLPLDLNGGLLPLLTESGTQSPKPVLQVSGRARLGLMTAMVK